jgi:hypothetical protein
LFQNILLVSLIRNDWLLIDESQAYKALEAIIQNLRGFHSISRVVSGFEALEKFQNLIGFLLRFSIETITEGGDLFAHNAVDAWSIRCFFSFYQEVL